jgi:hypothetical protein
VRSVFEALATREQNRSGSLSAACLAACGKRPDASVLRWAQIDLVPAAEIADIKDSSLSTPYTAWVLAARHRQRALVFWTCVIALAEDPLVRLTAETLAHEALSDGSLLRRERRLESLLLKDIIAWSQGLTPAQRDHVTTTDPSRLPPHFLMLPDGGGADPASGKIEQIKRRAEQRSNIYLDEAESATDQSSMELAHSIHHATRWSA